MAKDKNHKSHPSTLENTHLSFEYNISWGEERKILRDRTHKQ